jgi:hypothetical protein
MSAIDLYWLPLGAGGHSVRLNGLVFEAIAARLQHRGRADLYQLRTGEMWNSNSFISGLLVRSGFDAATIRLPPSGRAPGWDAGVVVAQRQLAIAS